MYQEAPPGFFMRLVHFRSHNGVLWDGGYLGGATAPLLIEMSRVLSRRYCFTVNNPSDEDCECVYDLSTHKHHKYLIVGTEKGEEGTPHLQCYVVFSSKVTFSAMKKLLPRAHIEVAKGTSEQNRDYCKKDGDFEEFGDCPSEGGKQVQVADWDHMRRLAEQGKFEEIQSQYYVKYKNAFHSIFDDACNASECIVELDHLWITGATGIGKSRYCFDNFPNAYRKGANKWWCHYTNQDVVILEDVEPSQEKWIGYYLKIWSDHYPFIAERKGGSRSIRPKRIIVTSNYTIREIFTDPKIRDPLLRRFKERTIVDGVVSGEVGVGVAQRILLRELGRDHFTEL